MFSFSIRNTTLKAAFKEIDKFYVFNSQESLAIETFLRSVSTDLSCKQAFPTIQKITKSKIIQLVSAMRATEETVDRFSHVMSVFQTLIFRFQTNLNLIVSLFPFKSKESILIFLFIRCLSLSVFLTCSQFHQQFTRAFFVLKCFFCQNPFCQSQNVTREKLC